MGIEGNNPQLRNKKMLTTTIISVIVFAATFSPMWYFYTELESVYTILKEEHEVLTANYEPLEENYTETQHKLNDLNQSHQTLQQEYMELSINYTQLEENYQTLTTEYETLTESYSQLLLDFNNLTEGHQALVDDYHQLQLSYQQLNITYHNLKREHEQNETAYEELQNVYHSYKTAYRQLISVVNLHVVHPSENETLLITPEDLAVKNKVEEITQGWSDPTDWAEYWNEVKMMYDWVVDNIEYRYDSLYPTLPEDPTQPVTQFDEMWQFPNQTLDLRKGDCDDMAILLASMIYSYSNMEHWVECIVITQHMAVYIPVAEDEICILDPAGRYYTNTGHPFYEITSRDVSKEVHAWLDYWSDGIENPMVEWIFSMYIWKDFWQTELFINWLYER